MNVNLWGPPLWDTLQASAFLCDAKNINAKNLFQSLSQLLPCKYCRDSYTQFYAVLGPPATGQAAEWVRSVHSLVNRKLASQRLEAFLLKRKWPDHIVADLRANNSALLQEPSMEVLQKKFMVNREEPIVWRNVSTVLLAFYMNILASEHKDSVMESLRHFLASMKTIVGLSSQGNTKLITEILKELMHMKPEQALDFVKDIKYETVVGPTRPLRSADEATRLIKAGQCINGSCS
jgi:hypothetical protein